MRTPLMVFLAVSLLAFGAIAATAATITEHDVANADAGVSNTVALATVAANVTATPMVSFGALGAPFNFFASFCYLDWPTGAIDLSKYYEFAITPDAGWQVQYTDACFAVASGGSGTVDWEIRTSLDGFGSAVAVGAFPADATWYQFNPSIAAVGTQLASVTFRFYMYNAPASGFTGLGVAPAFGPLGKNFFINGNTSMVPIPTEATSWGKIKAGFLAP